jgi:hypothetical protein
MAVAPPHLIEANDVSEAWLGMARCVLANGKEVRNLVVAIADPVSVDPVVHAAVEDFCRSRRLLTPKHVAYTIFPEGLARARTASQLFDVYNRRRGFFDCVKTGWGTYFRRMTCYEGQRGRENQLDRIIHAVNSRKACHRAAYTVVIQQPGRESVRPRGAPCLNYLAVQMEPGQPRTMSLLAVYRNHDVVERAYGNFIGLGWLLRFLCRETGSCVGGLTCMSSRAYIDRSVRALRELLETLGRS